MNGRNPRGQQERIIHPRTVPVGNPGGMPSLDSVALVPLVNLPTALGEGHITILPWNNSGITQGTWVISVYTSQIMNGTVYNSSDTQNDEIVYLVYLAAGTYQFKEVYVQNVTYAILTLLIDGVSVGTIDNYGVLQVNVIGSISNIVISTSGLKAISCKAATRNALNTTHWFLSMSSLAFWRTA